MTDSPERSRYDEASRTADPAAAATPPAPAGAAPTGAVPPGPLPDHQVERTRTAGVWVAVVVATVVLILLLVFILQNMDGVTVRFLGLDGGVPLGVAMLLAATAGALLVALIGAARIMQLRRTAKRHRHLDAGSGLGHSPS